MYCKIKRKDRDLTKWERRNVREYVANLVTAYNLEYLIVTRK